MKPDLVTVAPESFAQAAAETVREEILSTLAVQDEASLLLSGGTTPLAVYSLLGEGPLGDLPYERLQIFFGDERWVPPKDEQSNGGEALRRWLVKRGLPPSRFHPFFGSDPPSARRAVEEAMTTLARRQGGGVPSFDLALLGLGEDGHVASLFPGSSALHSDELTAETTSPAGPPRRLTVTFPVLNKSRRVLLLVKGRQKAGVLGRFLDRDPELVASRLEGPKITVLADLEASAGLTLL